MFAECLRKVILIRIVNTLDGIVSFVCLCAKKDLTLLVPLVSNAACLAASHASGDGRQI